MVDIGRHCIRQENSVADALIRLNELGEDLTLFVLDSDNKLVGSITDGDIRRGLLNGISLADSVTQVMCLKFKSIRHGLVRKDEIQFFKDIGIGLLPVLDDQGTVRKLLNLALLETILPLEVVIMAGGEGKRLRPLTESIPKPLLKVGGKPILERNLDRLINFGVESIWISVGYLGKQIEEYFGNGHERGINIRYVYEDKPLGTIGAALQIRELTSQYILVINSDILSNINFKDFFEAFLSGKADLAVATIPYTVNIPYAVLETSDGNVVSFREKPSYTYHSNAGMYLIRKEVLDEQPHGPLDATDLMERLIKQGRKVISFPFIGYWLDIGQHEDYVKANEDIKRLRL